MHASAFNRYLVIRTAENRIEFTHIDSNAGLVVLVILIVLIVRVVVHAVQIKLFHLPGLSVFRKSIGIGGSLERLLRDEAGDLMMSMSVSRCSSETRNDDLRSKVADDPYKISEDLIVVPLGVRIISAFRKTKLVVRREKLLRMIQAMGGHQFFCSNDSQHFKELASNEVHSTFTPGGGQVGGSDTLSSCKPGQQSAVFVIRMRASVKHAGDDIETFQRLGQTHRAPVFGNFGGGQYCRRNCQSGCGNYEEPFPNHQFHIENLINKLTELY